MEKKDFEFDADQFQKELGVTKFAVKGAMAKLDRMIEHWIDLGANYLGKGASFNAVPNESRVDGEVLGKKFSIHYSPLSKDANGVLEVGISAQHLVTGKPFVVSQFLIKPDGAILTLSGEELLNRDDSEWSYKMMVAVLRRVLSTSAADTQ